MQHVTKQEYLPLRMFMFVYTVYATGSRAIGQYILVHAFADCWIPPGLEGSGGLATREEWKGHSNRGADFTVAVLWRIPRV